MIGFAARVAVWHRTVDAGRRGPTGDRGGATSTGGPWRSGAAEWCQTAARVVESII
jgi:hypothetical protein